jgi:hypothetical protein
METIISPEIKINDEERAAWWYMFRFYGADAAIEKMQAWEV